MCSKKGFFKLKIHSVEVRVSFSYDIEVSVSDHDKYEIDDITFQLNRQDITPLIWETTGFDEDDIKEKCINHLKSLLLS